MMETIELEKFHRATAREALAAGTGAFIGVIGGATYFDTRQDASEANQHTGQLQGETASPQPGIQEVAGVTAGFSLIGAAALAAIVSSVRRRSFRKREAIRLKKIDQMVIEEHKHGVEGFELFLRHR